jgi:hypothetical protein
MTYFRTIVKRQFVSPSEPAPATGVGAVLRGIALRGAGFLCDALWLSVATSALFSWRPKSVHKP